jgi:hypothetical protein
MQMQSRGAHKKPRVQTAPNLMKLAHATTVVKWNAGQPDVKIPINT